VTTVLGTFMVVQTGASH